MIASRRITHSALRQLGRRAGSSDATIPPGSTVAVTGANGYIGSFVVAELLGRGFAVRAAVLDASPAGEAAHLGYMNGADERLTLVGGCDLDVDGSYDSAFAGADAVVHTAAKVRASRRAAERVARRSRRPVSPCIARAVGQE